MEEEQLQDIGRILAALAASINVVYDRLVEYDMIDPTTKAYIIATIDDAFEGEPLAIEKEI